MRAALSQRTASSQFESLMIRLLTEEASQHKRNNEDEILAAFQALDADKKGYLEKVSFGCLSRNNS